MENVYLWGAGNAACEVEHIICDLNRQGESIKLAGLISNSAPRYENMKRYDWIDTSEGNWHDAVDKHSSVVICVGDAMVRKQLYQSAVEVGLRPGQIVHPSAVIGPDCSIGDGCIIGPNVTLSNSVDLASNAYVSFNASIGHHSKIGEHSVLSPGTRIGGLVVSGECLFTGLNAVVVPEVKIGRHVQVSANALVTSDVRDNALVISPRSRTIDRQI